VLAVASVFGIVPHVDSPLRTETGDLGPSKRPAQICSGGALPRVAKFTIMLPSEYFNSQTGGCAGERISSGLQPEGSICCRQNAASVASCNSIIVRAKDVRIAAERKPLRVNAAGKVEFGYGKD
jgi:hypothetical protein